MMTDGLSQDEALLSEAALASAASLTAHTAAGWRDVWKALVELGWPGVLAPAEDDGFDGSLTDLLLLSRALGARVVKAPFLSDAAMVTPLLDGAPANQRSRLLRDHLNGRSRVALAYQEGSRDPEGDIVRTHVEARSDGFVLNGAKRMVLYGGDAETLIVSATNDGELSLIVVPRSIAGVLTTKYSLVDGTEAADFQFEGVVLADDAVLGKGADARARLKEAVFTSMLAAVGEAIGCVETAVAQTTEHLTTRQQFGAPLASFQVLRHRVADMYVAREELFSLGLAAARADSAERLAAIRTAKTYLGQAGVWAVEQAVQIHGAMGVTEECRVGQVLKRMIVLDRLFGGADHHIARLGFDLLDSP